MDRALDLITYYAECPPAHIVLALAFLKREPKRSLRPANESTAMSQMRELSGMLGQHAERMPDYLRQMATDAMAEASRLRN